MSSAVVMKKKGKKVAAVSTIIASVEALEALEVVEPVEALDVVKVVKVPKAIVVKERKTPAVKEKKVKKAIQVVAVVTPDGIDGTFTPESRRPLIVHLPFRNTEVSFNDSGIHYDPNPPPQVQPYDVDGQVYFQVNTESSSDEIQIGVEKEGWKMNLEEALRDGVKISGSSVAASASASASTKDSSSKAENANTSKPSITTKPDILSVENYQRTQLLACYVTKPDENFRVPEKTEVACFWCAHNFDTSPCFLPVKEESGSYHIYGSFCTPQCSLSYLLNEHLDSHVRWERMSLLHRMYRPSAKSNSEAVSSGRLYPAPPRESLKKFGGVYTYEQFREIIADSKVRVDIQTPPMVSILGTLDTKPIDFYDSSLQNTFTGGFSMDRFKSWSDQGGALRLKRSKPLKDKDSTLDACIKISVKRG